jgi:hypothetical protein
VAALLIPALWISVPTNFNFQFGQFHGAALVLSVLAMVAFEKGWRVWGGLALAVAVLAKLSPGILVLYLAARRRWREVLWVSGFAIAVSALAWVVLGGEVFRAFLDDQLPRFVPGSSSGEVRLQSLANNLAVGSVGSKLTLLRMGGSGELLGRGLSGLFALGLVLGTVTLARLPAGERAVRAKIWLLLLTLGAVTAPAAPAAYVVVSGLWLLSLAAGRIRSVGGALGLASLWILWQGLPPLPSQGLLLVLSLAVQLSYLAVPVGLAFSLGRRAARDNPGP